MISILLMLAVTTVVNAEKQTVVLAINSMECAKCQAKVEKTLAYVKGVKDLQVDLQKRQVTVTFDNEKTSVEKLQNTLVKENKYSSEVVTPSCAKECQKDESAAKKCCSGR